MHPFFTRLRISLSRASKEPCIGDEGASGWSQAGSPSELAWGPQDLPSDGVVRLNEAGKIKNVSARALELLHGSPSAKAGVDFWDAVPEDVAEQYQEATVNALTASAHHAFVAHDKFEGGWVRYTFRKTTSGYTVNLKDVASTQRLMQALDDSERYKQLMFEANPNAMWIFDSMSLRILAVNRAAVEFYGIPRNQFLTLSLGALFPDEDDAALLSSLHRHQSRGDEPLDLLLCKQKKMSGQLALVELACAQVSWNGRQSVFVSLVDITERHLADSTLRRNNAELEQALAKRQDELKNANRDLTAFAYALSHDLQGPLHAANGFATRLVEKYAAALDEPGRHYLRRIQASTRQLAKYLEDLRMLVQLPRLVRNCEQVDLTPICRAIFDDLRKRNPSRVATIEIEDSLPLMGDKALLVTALACLLDNAWKFTSKKPEAWITVGLLPGTNAGEVVVWVSDNGAGFDPAYSDKLFTPFQRLHSSADFAGNGLGLAIVKRVVEKHSGKVWAKTGDPAGARFFMSFPQGAVGPL